MKNPKELAEERISVDPKICSGKPCIKGTRITVADILLAMAEGLDEREILRNFRTIRKEDIAAALAYGYCVTDHVPINIKSNSGSYVLMENDIAQQELIEEAAQRRFSELLEQQAAVQDQITQEKIQKIQEEKEKYALPKMPAPNVKPYDLEIDLDPKESIKIFTEKDNFEQGLDMKHSNYIFRLREDKKLWLTYSDKDGTEIDKGMKRNIKLKYPSKDSDAIDGFKEGIFEGYLSTDRVNKIFIERDLEGNTMGRAL